MKQFRYILIVVLALLLASCGRRLDDTTVQDTGDSDTVAQATEAVEDAAPAEEGAAEATDEAPADGDTADDQPTAQEATDETHARALEADAANGQTLFNMTNESGFSCAACHYVDSTDRLVGPGMLGLADRAAARVEDQSAAEYLYNSILHPNDYVVESYPENVMPQTYDAIYTEDQVYDLVAYLLTLEDPAMADDEAAAEEVAAEETEVAAEEEVAAAEETEAAAEEEVAAEETEAAAEEEVAAEETEAAAEEEVAAAEETEAAAEEEVAAAEETEAAAEEEAETPEPQVIVVTATPTPEPAVIVVTATPQPDDAAAEEAPAEEEIASADEETTPDIVVTLASFGIASQGEVLFNQQTDAGFACSDCHAVEGGEYIDGPSLDGIAMRADDAGVPERVLYDAIVDPAVHTELGANYIDILSSAQIYDLVAYMLTLDNDVEIDEAPAEDAAPADDEAPAEDAAAADDEAPAEDAAAADGESEFAVAAAQADATNGETLFNTMNESGFSCSACHYVDSTDRLVGPGMLGLADRAGDRVEGQGAAEYLYNSILHPNDYVVEDYPEMVMPQFYADIYTEDQIYDLVAYLLTLTEE